MVSVEKKAKPINNVKAKFHCKTCDKGFLSKNTYEKHRKSQDHKEADKRLKKMLLESEEMAKLEEIKRVQAEKLNYALKHDPTGQGILLKKSKGI